MINPVEAAADAVKNRTAEVGWPCYLPYDEARVVALVAIRAYLAAKKPSEEMLTTKWRPTESRTEAWHAMRAQEIKELEQVTQQQVKP